MSKRIEILITMDEEWDEVKDIELISDVLLMFAKDIMTHPELLQEREGHVVGLQALLQFKNLHVIEGE